MYGVYLGRLKQLTHQTQLEEEGYGTLAYMSSIAQGVGGGTLSPWMALDARTDIAAGKRTYPVSQLSRPSELTLVTTDESDPLAVRCPILSWVNRNALWLEGNTNLIPCSNENYSGHLVMISKNTSPGSNQGYAMALKLPGAPREVQGSKTKFTFDGSTFNSGYHSLAFSCWQDTYAPSDSRFLASYGTSPPGSATRVLINTIYLNPPTATSPPPYPLVMSSWDGKTGSAPRIQVLSDSAFFFQVALGYDPEMSPGGPNTGAVPPGSYTGDPALGDGGWVEPSHAPQFCNGSQLPAPLPASAFVQGTALQYSQPWDVRMIRILIVIGHAVPGPAPATLSFADLNGNTVTIPNPTPSNWKLRSVQNDVFLKNSSIFQ
jgi:hypothetical protein